jgi:hypothetical protein
VDDVKVYLLHEVADGGSARTLKNELEARFPASLGDKPEFVLDSIVAIPAPADLGALSLVLLVLPDPDAGGLTGPPLEKVVNFLRAAGTEDIRLVPVALDAARKTPPAQLRAIFTFTLQDFSTQSPAYEESLRRLAVLVQNLIGLRVSSARRRVFISYKISDGRDVAERLEKELEARGYNVWRDEQTDRDGLSQILPGSALQQTIETAIAQQGFVLVVDSHEAPQSAWVNEEIGLALKYLLPILPVVVEDPVFGAPAQLGGRFKPLRDKQRQAPAKGSVTPARMDVKFYDGLEKEMSALLLDHLRVRRQLLTQAKAHFEGHAFAWRPVGAGRLVYAATKSLDGAATPLLKFRVLCQCAPYEVLLAETIANLSADVARARRVHQYGVLLHQTFANRSEREQLLRKRGNHLMLLKPDELDQVPLIRRK